MPPFREAIAAFLRDVGAGKLDEVKRAIAARPEIVNAVGPHPFWGGRPQALHVALETGRAPIIRILLKAGANVSGENGGYAGWSPMMIARSKGRTRWVPVLEERGARIGLGEALLEGYDEKVSRLLRAGLPPEPGGGSWLALARTTKAIDALMKKGASTTAKDRWGATPMEAISRSGPRAKDLLRHLAAKGVKVDAEAFARIGDRAHLAKEPPERLLRPDVVKSAVDFGKRALVTWLLDRGADPNARSTNRLTHDTCLHSAVWNGDVAMVKLLLERGADPELRDDEHHGTPYEWAGIAEQVTNNPKCRDAGAVIYRMRQASAKPSRGKRGKSAAGSP